MSSDTKDPQSVGLGNAPTIFADKITAFGIGPGVSKLTFTADVLDGSPTTAVHVIMPTQPMLEAMDYVLKLVAENDELRQALFGGIDSLREKVVELGQKSDKKV